MACLLQPKTPHLRGPDVHVFKEGRLWLKPSFLRPKRPCIAHLRGLSLRLTTYNPCHTKSYLLSDAVMQAHLSTLKLVIRTSHGPVIQLRAENITDFNEWADAFADAMNWSFERFYDVASIMGRGAFAVVKRARHRTTNDDVAVKIISKKRCTENDVKYLQREIDIALTLRHPNIVRTSDLFQSQDSLYIVLELLPGGTLQTAVESNGPFSEDENRTIMTDILKAIKYIHSKGVVHRDLKPENILCTADRPPMSVKLIDFGLARRIPVDTAQNMESFASPRQPRIMQKRADSTDMDDLGLGPDGLMTTPVGTPHFVAPEVLCSLPYSQEVDLFACGVILYWLLSGRLPFEDVNATRLAERIKRVEYNFAQGIWSDISPQAKDLVSKLLQRSPFARISAADALSHPWFDTIGGAVPPRQPGDIVIPQWTADPGFDRSRQFTPTSRQNHHHHNISKRQHDAIPQCERLSYSGSPVTPDGKTRRPNPFREATDPS